MKNLIDYIKNYILLFIIFILIIYIMILKITVVAELRTKELITPTIEVEYNLDKKDTIYVYRSFKYE